MKTPQNTYPHSDYITLDQETAFCWFSERDVNRQISEARVTDFANMVLKGKWINEMPEAIFFNKEGRLANGQHRIAGILTAFLNGFSGTIKVCVCFDAPDEVIENVDRGRAQTLRESEEIKVKKGSSDVTRGWVGRTVRTFQAVEGHPHSHNNEDFLDLAEKGLTQEAIQVLYPLLKSKVSDPAIAAFLYAYPVDPQKVTSLAEEISTKARKNLKCTIGTSNADTIVQRMRDWKGRRIPVSQLWRLFLHAIHEELKGRNTSLTDPEANYEESITFFKKRREKLGLKVEIFKDYNFNLASSTFRELGLKL